MVSELIWQMGWWPWRMWGMGASWWRGRCW